MKAIQPYVRSLARLGSRLGVSMLAGVVCMCLCLAALIQGSSVLAADLSSSLVWIPPGTFVMGSPDMEQDRDTDEGPQTTVTLTKGFYIGRYEVTQGQYLAVIGSNPSYFTGDTNLPVEQVSWSDATDYCATLTAQERDAGRLPPGWEYRLPTEAQWEYACRAGTTTRFSYGDDPDYSQLANYAWYTGNSGGHDTSCRVRGAGRSAHQIALE